MVPWIDITEEEEDSIVNISSKMDEFLAKPFTDTCNDSECNNPRAPAKLVEVKGKFSLVALERVHWSSSTRRNNVRVNISNLDNALVFVLHLRKFFIFFCFDYLEILF